MISGASGVDWHIFDAYDERDLHDACMAHEKRILRPERSLHIVATALFLYHFGAWILHRYEENEGIATETAKV